LQNASIPSGDSGDLNQALPPILDFRVPAKKVMPGVVHIISTYKDEIVPRAEYEVPDLFKDFFGEDFKQFFDRPYFK
jgi:hypothetical protein